MSRPKILECETCEGVFKVGHDMSEKHYIEKHCVFCGSKLELELGLDPFEDEDDIDYEELEW
jgi:hypothetical protein